MKASLILIHASGNANLDHNANSLSLPALVAPLPAPAIEFDPGIRVWQAVARAELESASRNRHAAFRFPPGAGLGKALLSRILSEAGREGHPCIVRTASRLGYPLYRQFGFEQVFDYRIYRLAENVG